MKGEEFEADKEWEKNTAKKKGKTRERKEEKKNLPAQSGKTSQRRR